MKTLCFTFLSLKLKEKQTSQVLENLFSNSYPKNQTVDCLLFNYSCYH